MFWMSVDRQKTALQPTILRRIRIGLDGTDLYLAQAVDPHICPVILSNALWHIIRNRTLDLFYIRTYIDDATVVPRHLLRHQAHNS